MGHNSNISSFIQNTSYWDISKGYIYKIILQVTKIFYNLKNKVIGWLNKNKKKRESMKNNNRKRFLGYMKKIDIIDIILKYKTKSIYNKEIFFTCTVCDFNI